MHLIQIIRSYLGTTQKELAELAGISQADLCEMEIKTPYGRIEKYQRLSEYLGIPVHALVTNDCTMVPLSFFDKHPGAPYTECVAGGAVGLGRKGEEAAYLHEVEKLRDIYPALSKLVLPHYKLQNRPGYDILSFDEFGKPIYIEVKTTLDNDMDFALTKQEFQKAQKMILAGEDYFIYRYFNWGKKNQRLEIFDFKELQKEYEVLPATYWLNKKLDSVSSGIRHCREKRGMSKGDLSCENGRVIQ